MDKPTQKLLPFDAPAESHLDAVRYEPSDEALAAYERLEGWLKGLRGPVTELAEETLLTVRRALIDGQNGFWHAAENNLEALKLRNGKTEGDDIPEGVKAGEGEDFQQAVDEVLDCLHERFVGRGR